MSQAFPFLELPPEIRERIYILTSTSPNPYILLNAPNAHVSFPLNLLLTNVQIYHELRPLYLTSNGFSITILKHNDSWDYFLSPSWLDNRRKIHTLRLNIFRWGTKDFFTKSLVPALEDCILNGRLRDLEVRMRESWMENMKAGEVSEGNANWRALRSLLGDPYLKRSVLMAGQAWPEVYDWEPIVLYQHEPFQHVEWVFVDEGEGAWHRRGET